MINYWLDKINNDKEIEEKINEILSQDSEEKEIEERDWFPDL